ncbi:hypothetical protein HYN56_20860 [Flavobacterium crocinum]|uniref:Uncharacterized protein n=1 Tax=Flavobacterium crocinum TaxID=2183896 RepID=A0A2S1YR86_9FLAO|nr:hypothetical protein HYN56_20860 [Flavobacterium crocinum]
MIPYNVFGLRFGLLVIWFCKIIECKKQNCPVLSFMFSGFFVKKRGLLEITACNYWRNKFKMATLAIDFVIVESAF